MVTVNQFHSGTAEGDAVTQNMLELRHHLRAMGYQSSIYAEHIPAALREDIRPIAEYAGDLDALLLVHHSMGHRAFERVLALPDRIATVYHNITPERFLTDEGHRRHARVGRDQLRVLASRSECGMADSNFNRKEMLDAGFRRVDVLPPRTDFSLFKPVAGDPPRWRTNDWLFVGRLIDNKCQHDLIRAFAAYARSYDAHSRLLLVGDDSNRDYVSLLRQEATTFGVADRVLFKGKLTSADLLTCYRECGVFVCLSEHEGFGVPLVEAMAAGLPVVAFESAAVPETLGGAGILLQDKDPWTVAGVAKVVLDDPELRHRLVERQFARVAQIEGIDVRATLRQVIEQASGAPRPVSVQVQGPFETTYSLAILNRNLALELADQEDLDVSLFATEGPGDYVPRQADLDQHPEATRLYQRSRTMSYPDVVIRQMYPPRVSDSPGGITLLYFGWEESRLPDEYVKAFNRHLDGIGATSTFVERVLRECGVTIPILVTGDGVEPHDPMARPRHPALKDLRSFRFLNIGSAFPRKGLDVLLKAFFDRFDDNDDVSLILKTFPNEHNKVGAILEELTHGATNPPDVRWIDEDLPPRQLRALYNVASCYVHPARGEGFGLPVAEAMLADVPVVTVAYSGLADFCSDETVLTVPFTVTPADTHLSVPGSTWAEPDRRALGDRMREIADGRWNLELSARRERARQLIESQYNWTIVGRRWRAFIDEVEAMRRIPRVAMVTTWNARCGIAENTGYIVKHLRGKADVEIYADTRVDVLNPEADEGILRCWRNRWEPDLSDLKGALARSPADVIHVQFNFGFFELERLADLLESELPDRPVIVTLHSTRDVEVNGETVSLRQIAGTLEKVDRVIVHQEADARVLAELEINAKIEVIPIGTPSVRKAPREDVRAALGIGARPMVSTFGFLLPHKGTLGLIQAVDRLRGSMPDILLVAASASYPDESSRRYEEACRAEIERRHLEENVVLITDFLPDAEAQSLVGAADLIVMPYKETQESSSAAMRFVLPLGRPIAAPDIAIFRDARDALALVPDPSPAGLAESIGELLADPERLDELAGRTAAFAKQISWDAIAARHRALYSSVMGRFSSRAAPYPA